jgi:hypothetical protein
MHRWLRDMKLTRKRLSTVALQRTSERVQSIRRNYAVHVQPSLPRVVDHVLFTDESHFDERSQQRRYGRAKSGTKALTAQPYNGGAVRRQRVTLMAAVGVRRNVDTGRLDVVLASRIHHGSTTAQVYEQFVRQVLDPAIVAAHYPPPVPARRPPPLAVAAAARVVAASRPPVAAAAAVVPARRAAAAPARPRRVVAAARRDDFVYDCESSSDDDSSSDESAGSGDDFAAVSNAGAAAEQRPFTANDVVVCSDNWSGHHQRDVVRAFATSRSGMRQCFVPPYSPDFNLPIEGLFGDVKKWLRRHCYFGQPTLTDDVVLRAVRECATVSAILGRAKRAGYAVSDAELAEARTQDVAAGRVAVVAV